ncbi:MAG: VOC family protein [Polyangiaceae bacterium]|nr:VOC family protein [Polyangiaceae bacterium]
MSDDPAGMPRHVGVEVGHLGIVCRSAPIAARFYGELLGLRLANTKTLPAALARDLFGVDAELPIVNYVGDRIHFEIFLHDDLAGGNGSIAHTCLECSDPEALVERARAMGYSVCRAPRGDGWVTLIDDLDGHRFEIKPAYPVAQG